MNGICKSTLKRGGFAILFSAWGILNAQAPATAPVRVLTVEGRKVSYSGTAALFTVRNEAGEALATVGYTAYRKWPEEKRRPLTFAFNGGPGSPAVWLHLGALGPYRISLPQASVPAPPFSYEENPYSWIEMTDLVLIDPIMTGFSRPGTAANRTDHLGYAGDLNLLAEFIRQFLLANNRMTSPKVILGESYGALRAIGLADKLINHHNISLMGLILVSGMTGYQYIKTEGGNDLPFALQFPTLAATGWYHGRITGFASLQSLLNRAESFTLEQYVPALAKGSRLTPEELQTLTAEMQALTGVPSAYWLAARLRPEVGKVNKVLLKDRELVIGRLDTRITGYDVSGTSDTYGYDPSFEGILKVPYSEIFLDYVKDKLQFDPGALNYDIISGRTYPWNFQSDNQFLDNTSLLARLMVRNPHLQVWVSAGCYDLGVPYFGVQYALNHLWLPEPIQQNLRFNWYEGGHMFYHDMANLKRFHKDAQAYYQTLK